MSKQAKFPRNQTQRQQAPDYTKQRYATESFTRHRPQERRLLRRRYPHNVDPLYGRLLTNYTRITLVAGATPSVTIDLDLSFMGRPHRRLPHIAIIEVKRRHWPFAESPAVAQLRRHVRPSASVQQILYWGQPHLPYIKHNNFKPTLRLLQ